MSRSDDSFSLDDMMEIFGDSAPAPAAAVAAAPSPPPAAASVSAPSTDSLSDDELAILEAYEKSRKAAKARDEEARRKKEEEAKRILEDYEKQVHEQQEREAKKKLELEEKQKRELEELKKKEEFKLDADRMAEEERKIIEEFERATRDQKEKEDAERKQKEAAAQEELARLAAAQKAEDERRKAEEAKQDEALQAKASEVSKKDSRLLELLAKAQQDLAKAPVIAPLPGMSAVVATPGAPGGSAKDVLIDIEAKELEAFLWMLDETRKAMFTYLAPLIGIKASTNMLSKTVEKARAKAPVLLKDANWKSDGALREDGSVDPERIARNVSALPAASRVDDFLNGLRELVQLRIKTVEAGLGAHTAGELRGRCLELRPKLKEKASPEWLELFLMHVVE